MINDILMFFFCQFRVEGDSWDLQSQERKVNRVVCVFFSTGFINLKKWQFLHLENNR